MMNVQTLANSLKTTSRWISPPVSLYAGYNSVTGAGLSTAILGISEQTGADSSMSCTVCTSLQEVIHALGIQQSLSVAYGSVTAVDEKLDFFRNLKLTANNVSIVVYCKHVHSKETAKSWNLDPAVQLPSSKADIPAFVKTYGDSFLNSCTLGGEYFAVYSFYAGDAEQQAKVISDLSAKSIYTGVQVDGQFQANLDDMVKDAATRTMFSQGISGIENPVLPDAGDIVTYAARFCAIPLDMPTVIEFTTIGYEHVFGLTSVMDAVVPNRNYFVGKDVNTGLAASLAKLNLLNNQIADLISTYNFYGVAVDSQLPLIQEEAQIDMAAINAQIEGWEDDPTQSFPALWLPALYYGSPTLSITANVFGYYGDGGGDPFDDVGSDPMQFINARKKLAAVQLRGGKYVDALITTYNSSRGACSFRHGGRGGKPTSPLNLSNESPIVSFGGRSGECVDHLTFTSASGTISAGGNGGSDFPDAGKIPENNIVLGFRGSCGDILQQISIVYAGFNPVNWVEPVLRF